MSLRAIRLREGQELRLAISDLAINQGLSAAVVVSAVGSLSKASIRMAGASPGRQDIRELVGTFEIVSLIGTISSNGELHLHIAISDTEGRVIGGHLKAATVHTTVELVLECDKALTFSRRIDSETGFDELDIAASR